MNKKASLEIGINTIVILVIAMVVIGGGIAFIRGFFKLGEDKLKEPFQLADFGLKPSSTQPLVLQTGTIELKTGDEKVLKGGYYNKLSTSDKIRIRMDVCTPLIDTTGSIPIATNKPTMVSLATIEAPANSEIGFNVIIRGYQGQVIDANKEVSNPADGSTIPVEPGQNLIAGTYICTVSAIPAETSSDQILLADPISTAPITLIVVS